MAGYHTFTTPKTQAKIARILAALAQKHMTRDELQCLLGISKPTTRRYIEHLRAERKIRIARWRPTTGQLAPVFALGASKDAERPTTATRTERNREEWRRILADPERHERVKAAARVHGRIQRTRGKPQPWFAALLGARQPTRSTAP